MDLNKKIEILRKRNAVLQDELDKANADIENSKKLLKELADIKVKWEDELAKLGKQREEYAKLTSDLKEIKENLLNGII